MFRVLAALARAAAALLAAPAVLVWDGLRWIRQAVAPPPTEAQAVAAEIDAAPFVPCLPDIYTQSDPGSVARAWCAWHARLPHAPAVEPPVRDETLARWLHSLAKAERRRLGMATAAQVNGHLAGEISLPCVPAFAAEPLGDLDVAAATRVRALEIAARQRAETEAVLDWMGQGCDFTVDPLAPFKAA